MTVADVWVDKGKARVEGHDQHGAVRVVQKPAPYAPVRFPSVEQDWDAAARAYEIQKQRKKAASIHKFPPIPEEPPRSSFTENHVSADHIADSQPEEPVKEPAAGAVREEQPVSSVERDEVHVPPSRSDEKSFPIWSDAPSDITYSAPAPTLSKRMESQELGEFPGPAVSKPQASVAKPAENPIAEESEYESGGGGYETSSDETDDESTESGEANNNVQQTVGDNEESGESESSEDSEEDEANRDHERDVPKNDKAAIPEQPLPPADTTREIEVPSSIAPEKERENKIDYEHDEDVPMGDDAAVAEQTFPSTDLTREVEAPGSVAPEKESQNGVAPHARLRKRKNSESGHLPPNKEARLDLASSRVLQSGKNDGHVRKGDDAKPPSSSRNEFNRTETPDSEESDDDSDSSPQVRGQGVTLPSERKSMVVKLQLPQVPAKEADPRDRASGSTRPEVVKRSPTPRHDSPQPTPQQPISQPTSSAKGHSPPVEKPKPVPSVPRRDSPNSKPSQKRNVSFADRQASARESGSQPKSTPRSSNIPSSSQPSASRKKRASTGEVVYPKGISEEMINKIMKEADERYAKQDRQTEEYERKVQAAEEQHPGSEYLAQLREVTMVWKKLVDMERYKRSKSEGTLERLRNTHAVAVEKLEKMEKSIKRTSKHKHSTNIQPANEEKTKADSEKPPKPNGRADTASTVGATRTHVDPGTPNKPVSRTSPSTSTPVNKGRRQVAKGNAIGPNNTPQSSINSEGVNLPSMATIRSASQAKSSRSPEVQKAAKPKEPSSASEEPESESESESESGSDESESEVEVTKSKPQAAIAQRSPRQVDKPASSNPWSKTPLSVNSRTSLKSLINQRNDQAGRAQPIPSSLTTRKSVFSPTPPPGQDDSDDESESESDSSSSDGDDNTSTGRVQNLRSARTRV